MEKLRLGEVEVDFDELRVAGPRGSAPLTPQEARLLLHLTRRRGATVGRRELLSEVWGYSEHAVSRAVDNAVWRLRRKLEVTPEEPRWLVSTRHGGYRLELAPHALPPLPPEAPLFVGRAREVADVEELLDRQRFVAVVGPHGIGKTRLVQRISTSRSERGASVAWVHLEGVSNEQGAAHALGRALGVVTSSLAAWSHVLLVLDAVDDLPAAALRWLTTGPRVLATARTAIPEASCYSLRPLGPTDARALAGKLATDTASGLPLSIELGTPQTADRPLDEVMEQGWQRRTEAERSLLQHAACFTGSFQAEDLLTFAGAAERPALEGLVAARWLRADGASLSLPLAMRRFLQARGVVPQDPLRRLGEWLAEWAVPAAQSLAFQWEPEVDARLRAAESDLVTCLADARDPELAARLAISLQRAVQPVPLSRLESIAAEIAPTSPWAADLHLMIAWRHEAMHQWEAARKALSSAGGSLGHIPARSEWIGLQIELLSASMDAIGGSGEERLRQCIERLGRYGNRPGVAVARQTLSALVAWRDPIEQRRLLEESLADLLDQGSPQAIARAHVALVTLLRTHGDFATADLHEERALELTAGRDTLVGAIALMNRGFHLANLGRLDDAEIAIRRALRTCRVVGFRRGRGHCLLNLALVALLRGRSAEAHEALVAAAGDLEELPGPRRYLLTLRGLSRLLRDDWNTARGDFEAACALCEVEDEDRWQAYAGLSLSWLGLGDHERARTAADAVRGWVAEILAGAFSPAALPRRPTYPGGELWLRVVERLRA